jgi:hypothetical protein
MVFEGLKELREARNRRAAVGDALLIFICSLIYCAMPVQNRVAVHTSFTNRF